MDGILINPARSWTWWSSRLGIGVVMAAVGASVPRLVVSAIPILLRAVAPHRVAAAAVTLGLILVAIGPAIAWLVRVTRASRERLLDKVIWALAGLVAGVAVVLPSAAIGWAIAGVIALAAVLAAAHFSTRPDAGSLPSETDWLGRDDFVRTLAAAAVTGSEPVIALLGALGAGKTWVLRMVKAALESDPGKPIVVSFSAWLPSDSSGLARELVGSIESAVRSRYWWPGFTRAARGFAAAIGAYRPWLGDLTGVLLDSSQASRLRRLTDILHRLPCRVVVLVDEIDRMDRPELEQLFKLLRGAPDLENICFLCALDPEHAARTHAGPPADDRALERSREYLEKFFASRFELPLPAEEKMQAELERRIEAGLEANKGLVSGDYLLQAIGRAVPGWRFYRRVIATPRRLKAVAKSFADTATCSREGLNAFDLFNLCLLREIDFGLPLVIFRHARLLFDPREGSWTDSAVCMPEMVAASDDAADRKALGALVRTLQGRPAGGDIVALMGQLFPRFYEAGRELDKSSGVSLGAEAQERRICHPRYFIRYLTLAVPDSQFPESELQKLIAALNAPESESAKAILAAAVKSTGGPDTFRCWDLMRQLAERADAIATDARAGLVRAVSEWVGRMPDLGLVRPNDSALSLILRLAVAAKNTDGPTQAEGLLEVAAAALIPDAVSVDRLTNPAYAQPGGDLEGVDLAAVRRWAAAEFVRRYPPGSQASVFDDPKHAVAALYHWAEWAGPDDHAAAEHLEHHLGRNPSQAASILTSFGPDGQYRANVLRVVYGSWLARLLTRLASLVEGATGDLTAQETAVIAELKSRLEEPPAAAAAAQN